MLEGNKADARNPLVPEYRDYLIAKKFGYTYEQIQESPAVWLDWLLRIDGAALEAEYKASSKG